MSTAVISTHFNPANFRNPERNYKVFRERLGNVDLFTAELSFDGQYYIPDSIRLRGYRCCNTLFQKERLVNHVVERLPPQYDKVAWIDSDAVFLNPEWKRCGEFLLAKYKAVQLCDTITFTDHRLRPDFDKPSWAHEWVNGRVGRSCNGFAWMARRELFPLPESGVIGGGDCAVTGSMTNTQLDVLDRSFMRIDERIQRFVKGKVGCVPGTALHLYHGCRTKRNYCGRYEGLDRSGYDPSMVIVRNGLLTWKDPHSAAAQYVRDHFLNRDEDGLPTVQWQKDVAYLPEMLP